MDKSTLPPFSPTGLTDRIPSLDVLRGFAVLGILIMNIQSFSMPMAAYLNPMAFGYLIDINKIIWIISHLVASEKFISIFSILFGAGILIFTDKAIQKQRKPVSLHYRRMFWLLLIGLMHAYLLWYGDILVAYSLCGMLVFLFRKMKPINLMLISFLFFIVPIIFYSLTFISVPYWPLESYQQTLQSWKPDQEIIQHEIASMQGSWMQQMDVRVPSAMFLQTWVFLMETFWRVVSMMLLGMALYKWNILDASQSRRAYFAMGVLGITMGTFISMIGVFLNFENDWAMRFSMFLGRHFNYIGSVLTALGYIGILMLISKSLHLSIYLKKTLAAVGRMAFSNYILQTLICTTIFYGHGFGYFGTMGRIAQLTIVVSIWLFLMLFSLLWLKKFRFGPLEWAWRSLTYWKIQPLLR